MKVLTMAKGTEVAENLLETLVGAAGIEPATLGLEIRCSIRLSYAPKEKLLNVGCASARFTTLASGSRYHEISRSVFHRRIARTKHG
jgi:hypothetical protein